VTPILLEPPESNTRRTCVFPESLSRSELVDLRETTGCRHLDEEVRRDKGDAVD